MGTPLRRLGCRSRLSRGKAAGPGHRSAGSTHWDADVAAKIRHLRHRLRTQVSGCCRLRLPARGGIPRAVHCVPPDRSDDRRSRCGTERIRRNCARKTCRDDPPQGQLEAASHLVTSGRSHRPPCHGCQRRLAGDENTGAHPVEKAFPRRNCVPRHPHRAVSGDARPLLSPWLSCGAFSRRNPGRYPVLNAWQPRPVPIEIALHSRGFACPRKSPSDPFSMQPENRYLPAHASRGIHRLDASRLPLL